MTTYIFYTPKGKVKISHETLEFIILFAKKEIPRKFYEYILRHDPNIVKFKEETKTTWKYLYAVFADWIMDLYNKKEYKILWWQVLAVKSYVYKMGKGRHLECRFVTEAPDQIAQTDEFNDFCSDVLDIFMECAGYIPFIEYCNKYYFGVQKIKEFEEVEDRKVPFYVEVYDYDYGRYPFYADGYFSPKYWEDYIKAKKEFEDQACSESMLIQPWKYESELEKIVGRFFGSPKQRRLEE